MIYSPDEARKFAEFLADAVCPAWRRPDTLVMDSVPNLFDHQTGTHKKQMATPSNFNYLAFERPKGVGLVGHCIITWGPEALRSYNHAKATNWDPLPYYLPVFVEVNLNSGNTPVVGSMEKYGTTAYRLYEDIEEMSQKLRRLSLWPRHPGYTEFRLRSWIHGGK